MQVKDGQMSEGGARARRLSHALLSALLGSTLIGMASGPAAAFEIFGIKLWNSAADKEDAGIVDPLRYSATIEAPEADEDLRKALENASGLKGDEERPVSGSLGLMTKARATASNWSRPFMPMPIMKAWSISPLPASRWTICRPMRNSRDSSPFPSR